ncbi:MAG: glycosyltransferase family 4 protein [Bryobacteraceae bacterium]|nr:glycosyltransferase family 4 protein [Bryobacteraceae bacterium]
MKIALACERFDPRGGGLEQWACQFARRLIERGHEVHALAFRAAPDAPAWPRVHLAPWSESRLRRAETLERELPRLNCDVIHDLGAGWACDVLHPQMGSREANLRQDLRRQNWRERWLRALRPAQRRWRNELREFERRQYQHRAGLTIAVSQMVARDLRELHGVAAERIRVIPNGVDAERLSPERLTPLREQMRHQLGWRKETVFLFAAHNPRLKGIRPLFAAFGILQKRCPEARLVAIGKAPEPRFQRLAARLGVQDRIRFAGFVGDPLPYFAAADAFVLPTYYDACSLTVLEAWAAGLPVVTTRRNGAAELMTNGVEGFVIEEPDRTAALADAMERLTDPNLRRRMGEAARNLALCRSLERNVDEIEGVYREAAARQAAWSGAR